MSHVSREARQVRQEDKGVASELASDVRELDVVPDSRTSHARCDATGALLFFSMQSLALGVLLVPRRLACGGSVMPQACLPVAGIGQTGFLA
jgi:hypothetical protein